MSQIPTTLKEHEMRKHKEQCRAIEGGTRECRAALQGFGITFFMEGRSYSCPPSEMEKAVLTRRPNSLHHHLQGDAFCLKHLSWTLTIHLTNWNDQHINLCITKPSLDTPRGKPITGNSFSLAKLSNRHWHEQVNYPLSTDAFLLSDEATVVVIL